MVQKIGIIYVLTNKYMPNLVKIGKTKQSIEQRVKDLSNATGVPYPFDVAIAYQVPIEKLDSIEAALHKAFDCVRISPKREFFEIPTPSTLRDLIVLLGGCELKDDVTDEVQEAIDNSLDTSERFEMKKKRPNFDFFRLGLSVGDKIYYTKDNTICCTIVDAKHVAYKDVTSVSLSAVTRDLCQYTTAPLGFWKNEDGELLSNIYDSLYSIKERVCACEERLSSIAEDTRNIQAGFNELTNHNIIP